MLKKFFYGMMAATMLVATSCTDEPMVGGDEATVSFSISTPEIATRAFSEGTKATQLQYAVYDENGNYLENLTKTDEEIHGSATVSLKLKTGKTYNVVFWADNEDAPYTVDFAAKTMTIDYSNVTSNNENYDAFYKAQEITVKGDASINVELRRPFAQLNIGTNDMAAATAAGYTVNQTWVKVPAYNTLNLLDGSVNYNDSDIPQTQTFALADIPAENEKFPVEGYKYLAMNYILVGTTQELVDIEFGLENNNIAERKVGSVPVRRNYRTNIYGSLLTSNQDVNVEIKPGYDGQATLDALHNAALNGGTVVLTEDVVLTTPLQVYSTMTINLNGNTITADTEDGYAIMNDKGGVLEILNGVVSRGVVSEGEVSGIVYTGENSETTINGGTFNTSNKSNYVFLNSQGTLTINEATINGTSTYPIYSYNEGNKLVINNATVNGVFGCVNAYGDDSEIVINGGTFNMTGVNGQTSHIAYFSQNANVTINGGSFNKIGDISMSGTGGGGICTNGGANLTINGGNFAGDHADVYNWSNGTIIVKGGTYKFNPSYVADGYNVVETEVNGVKYYTVVKEGTNVENAIVSASQLQALGNTQLTGTYNLLADIDMTGYDMEPIMLKSGSNNSLVFNGNGHTIKNLNLVAATQNGMSVSGLFNVMYSGKDITVNDLRLVDAKSESGKYSAVVLAYNSTSTVINLNNVEVNGANISAETVSPLVGYTTGPVNLQNCKVANISMTGEKPEKIGAYVGTANTNGCVVTVTNCTNNTEYKGAGRVINGASMIIDGKYMVANADELSAAVKNGATNIFLQDGEYDIKDCGGKTLNLFGSQKAVLILKDEGESGCDYAFQNGNVTFNGLTINTTQNGGSYKGFAYMKGVFNNCNFVGAYSLNSANDFEFKNCTFDFKDGYFWTWAAKSVTFDGCTFNGNSKTILAHGYASTEITINNCTFAAQEKGFTGSGDNTACVEIDPAGSNTYTINFTGNNTKTDKYAGWIRVKDGSIGHVINGI